MAILFAVVARGTTILAKNAWCGGNFLEVTEQILAKIPSENNKLTYSHGRWDNTLPPTSASQHLLTLTHILLIFTCDVLHHVKNSDTHS